MTSNFQPAPEDFDDVRAHGMDSDAADVEGPKREPLPAAVADDDSDGEGTTI